MPLARSQKARGHSDPELDARDLRLFPVGWGTRILRKAAGQLADLVLKDFCKGVCSVACAESFER